MEGVVSFVIPIDPEVASDEQVLAFLAETQFIERPPFLKGIVGSHDLELSPGRSDE
jgi:hypothetical protein